jgi:hypothetical protein
MVHHAPRDRRKYGKFGKAQYRESTASPASATVATSDKTQTAWEPDPDVDPGTLPNETGE